MNEEKQFTTEGTESTEGVQRWTRNHLCIDVRGAMAKGPKYCAQYLRNDDGSRVSPHEAFQWFADHLAQGHEVVPLGACDDFDWKTGCRGHAFSGGDGGAAPVIASSPPSEGIAPVLAPGALLDASGSDQAAAGGGGA